MPTVPAISQNQMSIKQNFYVVPCVEYCVEHGLVEEAVSHPLGDDDVHLLNGQNDLLHLAPDDGDLVGQPVALNDGLSLKNRS